MAHSTCASTRVFAYAMWTPAPPSNIMSVSKQIPNLLPVYRQFDNVLPVYRQFENVLPVYRHFPDL